MVPVPVSAFAMYQNMMNAKKKSKKKNKNKKKNADPVKVTPMIAAELIKVAAGKSVKPKASEAIVPSTEESVNRNLPQVEIAEATAFADRRPMDEVDNGLAELVMFKKSKERKKNKTSSKKLLVNSTSSELKKKISPHASNSEVLPLSSLESSEETAGKIFEWLMDPITKEDFLKLYWERRPVHISRTGNRDYYSDVLSTSAIDSMLRKHNILYGKNLDITSYTNGERETFNTVGRAHAAVVWDYYRNGCSVRLLNPQTYHIRLLELNSRLQEVFGSFVGANAYLTPPNSQGFAPHYDDIEAFLLQIEGSKKWRVYAPRAPEEELPRTSSPNFSQSEIGDPVLEVHLKAGDLLYFPRGFIHQAATVPGDHSLHVTISTYQRNSWADFMEKIVPAALANAIQEDEEFRRGMPLHAMKHIGAVHSESDSREREAIMKKVRKLFEKLLDFAPVDAAADQMAKDFIHDALPPLLTSAEKKCSVLENSERMVHNGKLQGQIEVNIETPIRLTRSNILRLVSEEEEDTIKIYHSMENSLEYHGEEIQSIEIPLNLADAVEHLIFSYPNFVKIAELPLDSEADKIQIATELWERGLILTDKPLFTGTVQDD